VRVECLRESGVRSGPVLAVQDASSADDDVVEGVTAESNKGMKLTKLSAAPMCARPALLGRRCRLMPAPARSDAGTASQLIPGVRRTRGRGVVDSRLDGSILLA
jgi:hypothetical protein